MLSEACRQLCNQFGKKGRPVKFANLPLYTLHTWKSELALFRRPTPGLSFRFAIPVQAISIPPLLPRYTPLHRACWGGEARHTATARVFLEARQQARGRGDGVTIESLLSMVNGRNGNSATRLLLQEWADKEKAWEAEAAPAAGGGDEL